MYAGVVETDDYKDCVHLKMNVFEKTISISVYCNPIASKQYMDKLFLSKFVSFVAGVVDTSI